LARGFRVAVAVRTASHSRLATRGEAKADRARRYAL